MRHIYIDVAQKVSKRHIKTAVSLIMDADKQWLQAQKMMEELDATVPERWRADLPRRAEDLMEAARADEWPIDARFQYLCRLSQIPRLVGMSASWVMVRAHFQLPQALLSIPGDYREHELLEAYAFGACLGIADSYVQSYAKPGELATAISTDVKNTRKKELFRSVVSILRKELLVSAPLVRYVRKDDGISMSLGNATKFQLSRVIDSLHFAGNRHAFALRFSDAIAHGLRQFFSGQPSGLEFMRDVLGTEIPSVLHDRRSSFQSGIFGPQ
jgi:hypothetical protein